jgi:myo-inositol-1(or 4)-monophosphatase
MNEYLNIAKVAEKLAKQAADEIIMPLFKAQNLAVEMKAGGAGPVTEADKKTDLFLQRELLAAFPDCGWLSEEIKDNKSSRLDKKRVFIVDPIDGTRAFVNKSDEFVVSVGMVEHIENIGFLPVMGMIYQPTTGRMVSAARGEGIFVNGERFAPKPLKDNNKSLCKMVALTSHTERKKGMLEQFAGKFLTEDNASIALKLLKICLGEGDFVVTLKPKNEWDTAAAHCICNEAGFTVQTLYGKPLIYNRKEPLFPNLVACREGDLAEVLACVNGGYSRSQSYS